ncbi:MAG: MFS transporter [Candidatus Microthrix sp.]|nr:MFS transporter [Candidatus Microthrix sp.]
MLLASPVGGVLARRFDRRHIIMAGSAVQGSLSVVLAIVAWNGNPPPWALVLIVLGIRHGQRPDRPSTGAPPPPGGPPGPVRCGREISSAAMNGSRVLGPLLAALVSSLGTGWIFMINAGARVRHRRSPGPPRWRLRLRPMGRSGRGPASARAGHRPRGSGAPAGAGHRQPVLAVLAGVQLPAARPGREPAGHHRQRLLPAVCRLRVRAAAPSCWALCWADGRCTGCRSSPCPAFAVTLTSVCIHPRPGGRPLPLSLRSASSTSPW